MHLKKIFDMKSIKLIFLVFYDNFNVLMLKKYFNIFLNKKYF